MAVEAYFLSGARSLERNPVAAGVVEQPVKVGAARMAPAKTAIEDRMDRRILVFILVTVFGFGILGRPLRPRRL